MSSSTPAGDLGASAVVLRSRFDYDATVQRLAAAIREVGGQVFATIDQRAAALEVGLDLRPTTLLVWGNPKGGTPLMAAVPLFALELPLKLLIWQGDGEVLVAYTPISEVAHRYGVSGWEKQLAAMDAAADHLARSVT